MKTALQPLAFRFSTAGSALPLALALLLTGAARSAEPDRAASIERLQTETFGQMPDGRTVKRFTLRNAHGMSVKVIPYGAIITELNVPDRTGTTVSVVLGADTLDAYLKGFPASAAVIGRFANRIAGAEFSLDGKVYKLAANNGPNHIHGGPNGFAKQLWDARALPVRPHSSAVRFTYRSKDGEEGYPGNLTARVTYSLNDRNEFRIEYQAVTDQATPVNLTNHAYFNLAGAGDVRNHVLWLAAGRHTPANDALIPTGEIAPVEGTPLDFTSPARIGARIDAFQPELQGYDHNFALDTRGEFLPLFARLRDPDSGRVMEAFTSEPGVQIYTGNHLRPRHGGVCLETQHFPDSVHHENFPSAIVRPGEQFRSTTMFKFHAE